MGKLEIIVVLAFIALVFSSQIREPAEVTELRSLAWKLECDKPICLLSKVQLGAWADKGLLEKTKQEILNGSTTQALTFLLVKQDPDIRETFKSRIDEKISQVRLGETPSDELILIAEELKFRTMHNQTDEQSQNKLDTIRKWLIANGTRDFLYLYSLDTIYPEGHINISTENLSLSETLLWSIDNSPINSELIGPSSLQVFLARGITNNMWGETSQERIAEDLCVLTLYYSMAYPAVMIKDSIFTMIAIYALPLAIVCWISVLSYLTSQSKEKSVRFQKDYSKNVILTSLLALILFPLLVYTSLLFSMFPAIIYIIFIIPILFPAFFYIWSSTNLLKEYGLVKVSRESFLIARYKESILIAAGGALITLISLFVIVNMQRIFSYMSLGLVSALAVIFLLIFFSIFTVILFPRFIELTSSTVEIKNSRMRKRLESIAEKFGYNLNSIKIIPSAGSNLANAFQSGLVGNNVKLFIFETMLDKRKFKDRELEAIIAHELAHVHKKHVLKTVFGYLVIACWVIVLFVIISLLLEATNLSTARELLAMAAPYTAMAVAFLTTMWMMRKFEFEADSAAAEIGYGDDLISALKKIDKHNLTPSTISRLVLIFSSHADLDSRIKNLRAVQDKLSRQ